MILMIIIVIAIALIINIAAIMNGEEILIARHESPNVVSTLTYKVGRDDDIEVKDITAHYDDTSPTCMKDMPHLYMYEDDHPPAWHDKSVELVQKKYGSDKMYVYTQSLYESLGKLHQPSNKYYFNPINDYSRPVTECILEYNKYCHDRVAHILDNIEDEYLVLIFVPCEDQFDIPDGDIIMPVLCEADVPQIYVKGKGKGTRVINVNDILCQLRAYYKSDAYKNLQFDDYEEYFADKSSLYQHNIEYYKAYKQHKADRTNIDIRRVQRDAEIEHMKEEDPYPRQLSFDHRRMQYFGIKDKYDQGITHWGQRKLFISEIEFLTKYAELANTILYVGAASGEHSIYLSKLFPNHQFIFYDPREFTPGLHNCKNVELHRQLFTDDDARQYIGRDLLFWCDIRNMDESVEFETRVGADMIMQMNWHNMLNPKMSMLKFRLPFVPGITEYLVGDIYYQVWAPSTSTELRLITNSHDITMYDNSLIEEICFRFNWVVRAKGNYDELNEKKVLTEYANVYGGDPEDIAKQLTDVLMNPPQ